MNSYQFIVWS